MRGTLYAGSVLLTLASSCLALWPQPTNFQSGTTALVLSSNFSFTLGPSLSDATPADLTDAISRTQSQLFTDQLERLVVGRSSADANATAAAPTLFTVTLDLASTASNDTNANGTVMSITQEAQKKITERDESYSLSIPADGSNAVLTANTTLGLFRGLVTFSQLWYTLDDGEVYTLSAPVSIEDAPVYVRRWFFGCHAAGF